MSGALLNKGFIVNPGGAPTGSGRTIIVTGLHRSGTSLVAAMLQQAGLFMGSEINDIVYEDEELARILTSGNDKALKHLIASRDVGYGTWGFKLPVLWRDMPIERLAWFTNPHLIVTFRDPVSIAVRTAISQYQEPMHALRQASTEFARQQAFVDAAQCPSLLLSYEKALTLPGDFVDALIQFCGLPRSDGLRTQLTSLIEPGRPRYIMGARSRYEGTIEGVIDDRIYGWCRLTHAAEPVVLDVRAGDAPPMQVVADVFRQDLLDAGIGRGTHGFFIPLDSLPARADTVIRISVAVHGIELENSGRTLRQLRRKP